MIKSIKQNNSGALSKNRKRFYDKCVVKAEKMLPNKKNISKTIKKRKRYLKGYTISPAGVHYAKTSATFVIC